MEIELPDGTIAEFPDDMPQADIQDVLAKQFPSEQPAPQEEATFGHKFGAVTDGLAQGLTFGFSDEIAAGLQSGFGAIGSYDDALTSERARMDENKRLAGGYRLGGEVPGAIAGAIGTGGAGLAARGGGLVSRAALAGIEGAAQGAVYGAGTAEGDRLTGAGQGAVAGALAGAIGQPIAQGLSKAAGGVAGAFAKKQPVMSPKQLKAAKDAAYAHASQSDAIYGQNAISGLRDDVQNTFASRGFHPKNEDGASVILDELNRLSQSNATPAGLEAARKVFSGSTRVGNKSNNKLVTKAISKLDNMTANPSSVISGDAVGTARKFAEGRELAQRGFKLDSVNDLLEKAGRRAGSTGSGGNAENATRQNLRRMLDSPKLSRGLSKDEKSALEKVVMGTATQNALRLAGKLSPQGNGLMLGLGGAGAVAAPAVAIPAMLGGMAAKKGAEGLTNVSVKQLQNLIASGGKKPPLNKIQKLLGSEKTQQLLRQMLVGSSLPVAN